MRFYKNIGLLRFFLFLDDKGLWCCLVVGDVGVSQFTVLHILVTVAHSVFWAWALDKGSTKLYLCLTVR